MSDSLWPHGLQHTRLLCPPLSPRVCSNTYLLSQWHYLTILFSLGPFSSCPQYFPASVSFPISRLFALGDQSVGASASVSDLPVNIQGWFPLRLTGLISLLSKGLSRVFSSTTFWKNQFFSHFMVQLSNPYMTIGKTIALTIQTVVSKVMSLLCNMLSRFVTAFLIRSKHLLISWLQSPSTVILEPQMTCAYSGLEHLIADTQQDHFFPLCHGTRRGCPR